jgi:hypothetical protein
MPSQRSITHARELAAHKSNNWTTRLQARVNDSGLHLKKGEEQTLLQNFAILAKKICALYGAPISVFSCREHLIRVLRQRAQLVLQYA